MNFLAGRLAAKEGAYFMQESKHAVGRLSEKKKLSSPSPAPSGAGLLLKTNQEAEGQADVLPEVLRHSLPIKAFYYQHPSLPSISTASKWRASPSPSSSPHSPLYDSHNPLKEVLCLPQVTFGPKRWNLPNEENSVSASTANELRRDWQTHAYSKKIKAAEEGLSQVGKSLAIATTAVFGGATVIFMFTASKLQMHNSNDIRTKGRDLLQPRFETIRAHVGPLRDWAEETSRKWHYKGEEESKEKPLIIKELTKRLGARKPN